jgi:hypothetical protein
MMWIIMTICLALKCKKTKLKAENPVLLFASDTQQSSQYLKRPVTKMRVIFGKPTKNKTPWNILIASAGDAMVADEAVDDIGTLLQNTIKGDEPELAFRLGLMRREIGDRAYATFEKHRSRVLKGDMLPYFTLLLGASDENSTILYVTCEGKQKILDQSGMIGTGRVTGGELLLREFIRDNMDQKEAAALAALIVMSVGNVDIHVGGGPEIKWCRNRRVWHYAEFKFDEIIAESQSKWHIIKNAWWKMQEDSNMRRKLATALVANSAFTNKL